MIFGEINKTDFAHLFEGRDESTLQESNAILCQECLEFHGCPDEDLREKEREMGEGFRVGNLCTEGVCENV